MRKVMVASLSPALKLKGFIEDARKLDAESFDARHGSGFFLHYGSLEGDPESINLEDTLVQEYTDNPVETPADPQTNFLVFPVRKKSSDSSDQAIWVGRGHQNDIIIQNGSISTMHAFIRIHADGRFYLQDMLSKNGTFLYNQRVPALGMGEPVEFKTGDRIRFGTVKLTFLAVAGFMSLVNQLSGGGS